MDNSVSSLPLKELLRICTDEHSSHWEAGWREFMTRYKDIIYQQITRRCVSWRVSRLRRQFSDTINDIALQVFEILLKSLSTFREVDNERMFILWLATVCNRATSRYLQREFSDVLTEPDMEEFQNYIRDIGFDERWELYEMIVQQLRGFPGKKKRNLERDINIFLLYTWSDLSQDMILMHPCYKEIGHRVVDNVVNRLREVLRKEKNR